MKIGGRRDGFSICFTAAVFMYFLFVIHARICYSVSALLRESVLYSKPDIRGYFADRLYNRIIKGVMPLII